MMDLNPFIEENEKRVKLYFEKMSEVEASDSSSSGSIFDFSFFKN